MGEFPPRATPFANPQHGTTGIENGPVIGHVLRKRVVDVEKWQGCCCSTELEKFASVGIECQSGHVHVPLF